MLGLRGDGAAVERRRLVEALERLGVATGHGQRAPEGEQRPRARLVVLARRRTPA